MVEKSMILDRAVELFAASGTGDFSTRAVCEAAGIGQPVLYRMFGDKAGLLAAVADRVWEQYLAPKRAATASDDPVQDLRDGWDNHTAFALANPHAYRLVFASALSTRPVAAGEAMELLCGVLERVAAQGRLGLEVGEAAQIVMAANSGIALSLILRPEQYPDQSVSTVMREATLRAILTDHAPDADRAQQVAATTLLAGLADSEVFTSAEAVLLAEWLERIRSS